MAHFPTSYLVREMPPPAASPHPLRSHGHINHAWTLSLASCWNVGALSVTRERVFSHSEPFLNEDHPTGCAFDVLC